MCVYMYKIYMHKCLKIIEKENNFKVFLVS